MKTLNFTSRSINKDYKIKVYGEFEGKKYFKNEATGLPYTSTFVTFGDIAYYAGADGYLMIDRDCEGLPKAAEVSVFWN